MNQLKSELTHLSARVGTVEDRLALYGIGEPNKKYLEVIASVFLGRCMPQKNSHLNIPIGMQDKFSATSRLTLQLLQQGKALQESAKRVTRFVRDEGTGEIQDLVLSKLETADREIYEKIVGLTSIDANLHSLDDLFGELDKRIAEEDRARTAEGRIERPKVPSTEPLQPEREARVEPPKLRAKTLARRLSEQGGEAGPSQPQPTQAEKLVVLAEEAGQQDQPQSRRARKRARVEEGTQQKAEHPEKGAPKPPKPEKALATQAAGGSPKGGQVSKAKPKAQLSAEMMKAVVYTNPDDGSPWSLEQLLKYHRVPFIPASDARAQQIVDQMAQLPEHESEQRTKLQEELDELQQRGVDVPERATGGGRSK